MRICTQCKVSFGEQAFRVCPYDGAALMEETAPLSRDPMIGRILDGRFRIVEVLGQGGMGAVYKAIHTQMDRICAIKLLTPVSTDKESSIARFRREAKMTSRIDSPNAVTIYDFGEAEPGLLYIAMEYIQGESLAQVLAREPSLAIERVLSITNQIAGALTAAHSLGIVHRDLKPANIMLTRKKGENEVVKVLDFGIAKSLTDGNDDKLTQTGFLLGTPTYMSPEQVTGENIDARSDVYSLAIIVYQMLSGHLPFEGDNLRTLMMKRVHSDPRPLRAIAPSQSEAVEHIVMSGLSRDPEMRIADVQTFAAALTASLAGTPSVGEFPTLPVKRNGKNLSATTNEETCLTPYTPATSLDPHLPPSITLLSPSPIGSNDQKRADNPVSQEYSQPTIDAVRWKLPTPAAPSPTSGARQSKLSPVIVVAFVVIMIAVLSAGGYYAYLRSKAKSSLASSQPTSQSSEPDPKQKRSSASIEDERTADVHYQAGRSRQEQAFLLKDSGSNTAASAKNEEAVAEYRKALESRTIFPEAHENLGVALYDLGKTEQAIAEYEIAIQQYEKPSSQVWTNYGMALVMMKRFQDGADAFSQALVLTPTDADLYYYRGLALHYAGDEAGSKEAFGAYLKVAPQGEHAKAVKEMLEGRAAPSLKHPA